MGEWISVEDRLPKGSDGMSLCESVIAATIKKEVVPGWFDGDYWYLILEEDDFASEHPKDYVTHWMELPQPPEGE